MIDPTPHIDWILREGRDLDLQALIDTLGLRIRAAGMPVMRLRLGIRTTHPLTAALSVIWEARGGPHTQIQAPQGLETRSAYVGSPMEQIRRTGTPFRRRLTAGLDASDHLVLHELKMLGATDYYGMPIDFRHRGGGIFAAVSEGPDGFSDRDINAIERIRDALAPIVEAYANYHLATSIATSYLGQRTGQRVLDGQITRGDIETIEAAVLISDIRDWTRINATRSPKNALELANAYFEILSDAVDAHEGEILKFLGDGVLALFPTGDAAGGRDSACRQAVAAARAARKSALDARIEAAFGIGIHFGKVLYGNIGAQTRIDFTVLGQAVNIAARIEALTAQLGHPVLVSGQVAHALSGQVIHVGTEPLKGLAEPMPVFAPVSL